MPEETISLRHHFEALREADKDHYEARFKASERALELALAANRHYGMYILNAISVLMALAALYLSSRH